MKKISLFALILLFFVACKSNEEKSTQSEQPEKENILLPKNRKDLITIKNHQYIEYYPGKKQIKFEGFVDDNNERDGKWVFYGTEGQELSVAFYSNGKRHGHTVVRYPSGQLHYIGEYNMDKRVGEWEMYDLKGKKTIKKYE
jgi:antitoxin component YwqK of YwqJK toxin-antitoxin module